MWQVRWADKADKADGAPAAAHAGTAVAARTGDNAAVNGGARGLLNGSTPSVAAHVAVSGDSAFEGSDGKLSRSATPSRETSVEDFEATAEPRANDGLGDADDLRHISAASSQYDPRRDVVLRMECSSDRATRVISQFR